MSDITKYPEINTFLSDLASGIVDILKEQAVGVYLFGSLTYGDFDPSRSDIDIEVVVRTPITPAELESLRSLHQNIESSYPRWSKRVECSYTPLAMLGSVEPPGDRPYLGEGNLHAAATYGNEWIINQYLLYHYSKALYGSAYKNLIKEIHIKEVQVACTRDLLQEWKPKLTDDKFSNIPHNASYLVLNLCRILHTTLNHQVSSKKVSADWVKSQYPQWQKIINEASNWHYGDSFDRKTEIRQFLQFALAIIPL